MAKKSRIVTPTPSANRTGPAANAANQADRLASRRDDRAKGRQAAAEARRRQKRIQRIALIAVGVLAIAALGFYVYREATRDLPGESFASKGRDHVGDEITVTDYNSDPPTSGPHWGSADSWGVKTEPVPNELQVHNLEHGGVVIQYNGSVTQEEIAQLNQIATQCNVKLILAPRPEMTQKISVTAWTWKLDLETVDEAQINDFIKAHVDNGPEKFESETELLERCDL